jgi:carbon storage regulator
MTRGMLVLGVSVGEYVQIGDDIKVCVMKHKNDSLRLSIIAPKDVKILRGAVIEKDRRAAEQKAQGALAEEPARAAHQ